MTEAEPTLASAPSIPAQRLDPEVLSSVHRDHVQSLEALWSMEDCDDARAVLEYLQRAVYAQGTSTGLNGVQPCTELVHRAVHRSNTKCSAITCCALTWRVVSAVVAMSGGTGSALLAYLLASVFDENTVACIGRSGSVPAQRLERARYTADLMGEHNPTCQTRSHCSFTRCCAHQEHQGWDVPATEFEIFHLNMVSGMDLWELDTRVAPQPKGNSPQLSELAPRSERAVYTSLAAISVGAASAAADLGDGADAVVFCGANARDLGNAARCGLRAAGDLGVVCPLADLSPDIVTQLAQVISFCQTVEGPASKM